METEVKVLKSGQDYADNQIWVVTVNGNQVGTIRKIKRENMRFNGLATPGYPWLSKRSESGSLSLCHRTKQYAVDCLVNAYIRRMAR